MRIQIKLFKRFFLNILKLALNLPTELLTYIPQKIDSIEQQA